MNNFWGLFLSALLGSVLAAPILALLSRSLVSHWLQKDLAKYQAELRSVNDKALEEMRGAIAASNIERQIVLAKLHEKRADAVYSLHKQILDCVTKAKHVLYNADGAEKAVKDQITGEFSRSLNELVSIFTHCQLYLSKDTCSLIDSSLKEILIPVHSYMFWMNIYKGTERAHAEYNKKWEQALHVLEEKSPAIVDHLELEFRLLLGVR